MVIYWLKSQNFEKADILPILVHRRIIQNFMSGAPTDLSIESCSKTMREGKELKYNEVQIMSNIDRKMLKKLETPDYEKNSKRKSDYQKIIH